MTEPTFQIRITPYLHITPRTYLYELKTRKNATILNGNRYLYNQVIQQINDMRKRRINKKDKEDLNQLLLLLS